eukprot:GEMP01062696.1.p1 GENE.GEMP01062696.1~~GEMP01062696.1.p1  ORF type:complete len:396 (-),score=123.83 GEMP01062696.1:53-1240(-)
MNADARRQLSAKKNARDIKKLQAAAGGKMPNKEVERLEWMYEQTSTKTKEEIEDDLMNTTIKDQKSEDVENMKKLQSNVAGSLFLKCATSATEDMMRKLREDPLFQIKQAELRRKESIMANPLLRDRIKIKHEKQDKKLGKKEKKLAKKEKKKEKKAKKKNKKCDTSSSSSSSPSRPRAPAAAPASRSDVLRQPASLNNDGRRSPPRSERSPRLPDRRKERSPERRKNRSPQRRKDRSPERRKDRSPERRKGRSAERVRSDGAQRTRSRSKPRRDAVPAAVSDRLKRRQEEEALKAKARGRGNQGLSAEEKARRLKDMMNDGKNHEEVKDAREKVFAEKEKEMEEVEKTLRGKHDRTVFKNMNQATYMSGTVSMEDRLKSNRHRRQKGILDPLEK